MSKNTFLLYTISIETQIECKLVAFNLYPGHFLLNFVYKLKIYCWHLLWARFSESNRLKDKTASAH